MLFRSRRGRRPTVDRLTWPFGPGCRHVTGVTGGSSTAARGSGNGSVTRPDRRGSGTPSGTSSSLDFSLPAAPSPAAATTYGGGQRGDPDSTGPAGRPARPPRARVDRAVRHRHGTPHRARRHRPRAGLVPAPGSGHAGSRRRGGAHRSSRSRSAAGGLGCGPGRRPPRLAAQPAAGLPARRRHGSPGRTAGSGPGGGPDPGRPGARGARAPGGRRPGGGDRLRHRLLRRPAADPGAAGAAPCPGDRAGAGVAVRSARPGPARRRLGRRHPRCPAQLGPPGAPAGVRPGRRRTARAGARTVPPPGRARPPPSRAGRRRPGADARAAEHADDHAAAPEARRAARAPRSAPQADVPHGP